VQNSFRADTPFGGAQMIAQAPRMFSAVTKKEVADAINTTVWKAEAVDIFSVGPGASSFFSYFIPFFSRSRYDWCFCIKSEMLGLAGSLLKAAGIDLDKPLIDYFPQNRAACDAPLNADGSCPPNKHLTARNDGISIQVCRFATPSIRLVPCLVKGMSASSLATARRFRCAGQHAVRWSH
jgi:hypothetical protein